MLNFLTENKRLFITNSKSNASAKLNLITSHNIISNMPNYRFGKLNRKETVSNGL